MPKPGSTVRPAAIAALLLCLSLAVPARAASEDPTDPTGWRKALAYARCAFELWRAVTPVEVAAALFDCGRMLLDEPVLGAGGE
jgi:hypothetical protein